jgi:hypothetical protein
MVWLCFSTLFQAPPPGLWKVCVCFFRVLGSSLPLESLINLIQDFLCRTTYWGLVMEWMLSTNPLWKWRKSKVRERIPNANHLKVNHYSRPMKRSQCLLKGALDTIVHIYRQYSCSLSVTKQKHSYFFFFFQNISRSIYCCRWNCSKYWVSGSLIGGSQKLEELPVTIRQAVVVVEHHRRTSQRTYLEPPVLSCYPSVFFSQNCMLSYF